MLKRSPPRDTGQEAKIPKDPTDRTAMRGLADVQR